jgi:hypothetical protein
LEVNPAYTSVIGQHKFARRYGISVHNAAALVMGRRFLGFSESLPLQLRSTLPLSARNRGRHVWSRPYHLRPCYCPVYGDSGQWSRVRLKQRLQRTGSRALPDPRRHLL